MENSIIKEELNATEVQEITSNDVIERKEIELTFGQKAVGINFNPSNRVDVDLAKQTMANAIDQMNDLRNDDTICVGAKRHASTAITMLEDAQMRMVKALTWQD